MTFARVTGTVAVLLFFGTTLPVYAQREGGEKQEEKQPQQHAQQPAPQQHAAQPKPQEQPRAAQPRPQEQPRAAQPRPQEQPRAAQPRPQEQPRAAQPRPQEQPRAAQPKPQEQPRAAQPRPQEQPRAAQPRPQEQPRAAQPRPQEQPRAAQPRPQEQPRAAQPQQQQRTQPAQQARQQPQRTEQQARSWQQQKGFAPQGSWQGHANFQQSRSQNWSSEHRTWAQRGGYGGYIIPQDRFSLSFGSGHFFRLGGIPTMYMGYPRFSYGGFSFLLVDPWPGDWDPNWYASDDVYIDYDYNDDGYYLYNRRYPQERLAVTIVL